MKFSRKVEYGLILLSEIARSNSVLPLSKLSHSHGLSLKFLEQVASGLKSSQIIEAKMGSNGGYMIKPQMKKLKIDKVLEALEGDWHLTQCGGQKGCPIRSRCSHFSILAKAEENLRQTFAKFTIADLIK